MISPLLQVFAAMPAGRAVHVAPLRRQLTAQEAADLLGISRPTLIKLLDAGDRGHGPVRADGPDRTAEDR